MINSCQILTAGSSGMGQAQSQTSTLDCGECDGQEQTLVLGAADKLQTGGKPGQKYPSEIPAGKIINF